MLNHETDRIYVSPVHWWVWTQTCLCFILLLMSWLSFCSGSAGYCFVELADESSVERCVQRLNGKLVPGSNPVSSFMWLLHICSISSTQSLQRSKIVVIRLHFKIYLLLPVIIVRKCNYGKSLNCRHRRSTRLEFSLIQLTMKQVIFRLYWGSCYVVIGCGQIEENCGH